MAPVDLAQTSKTCAGRRRSLLTVLNIQHCGHVWGCVRMAVAVWWNIAVWFHTAVWFHQTAEWVHSRLLMSCLEMRRDSSSCVQATFLS